MSRVVTGTIKHADGSAWVDGIVKFKLAVPFETATTVYPAETHAETLDALGEFSITLGTPDTGTAIYEIYTPDNAGYICYIASGPAVDLQTLITVAGTPIDPDAVQTLLDAHVASYLHSGFNVKSYGALGDGTHDDTTAIQAAITAAEAVMGKVFIPVGLYKITSALVCSGNVTIEGETAGGVWGPNANSGDGLPGASPWLTGSVLLQSTAATNAINITGTGTNVSIRNIGIRFADAIAFSNTGHGIYAVPTATISGGHDGGLDNCSWENLIVFGHDGNHYAFYTINMILGKFEQLRSYGGGGWYQEVDSQVGNLGNSITKRTYAAVIAGGSAHGYHLKSRTTSFPGVLNMCVMEQPQCNLGTVYGAMATAFPGITAPNGAVQKLYLDEGNPTSIYLISPDFECSAANPSIASFGTGTYVQMSGGYFSNSPGVVWNYKTKKARLGIPTVTPDNGAGSTGSPTINVWCNDEMGIIDFTTSLYPWGADSRVMTVTLQSFPTIGAVMIQPYMAADSTINSISAQFYLWHVTANSFDVYSHGGLAGTTRYAFQFLVVE